MKITLKQAQKRLAILQRELDFFVSLQARFERDPELIPSGRVKQQIDTWAECVREECSALVAELERVMVEVPLIEVEYEEDNLDGRKCDEEESDLDQ